MAEKEEKQELNVTEADDGSAVVAVPENLLESNQVDDQSTAGTQKTEQNTDSVDDADHPDDDEELRAAKRNRRRAKKDLIRKTNQEKDARLEQLQRENEEIKRRLAVQERNSRTDSIMRIDSGINDAKTQIEWAEMKLAEAVQAADGSGAVEAQRLLTAATNEHARLMGIRRQADQESRQTQTQPSNSGVDPRVQRLAGDWMRQNDWYNPEAKDRDSRVAKAEDELMAAEGWDPTDPDYWDELTSRLQKKLPHRYNERNQESDDRNTRRPRNNVASSGREASAAYGGSNRTQFVLSPERVKAMREAGAWDNPERKAKMIKQFIAYDRANKQ